MPLYTVFWGKLSIVKEIEGDDSHWQHLFSIEDDGKRSERAGLLGHKQFIPAYEFPDDKAAMVWFMLGYEK